MASGFGAVELLLHYFRV